MRIARSLFLSLPLLGALVSQVNDASACGGCFHQNEQTQVVGHRMILSVSNVETTLWDQIEYAGDPAEFAWVLPIKGLVGVGISSDALFQVLGQTTQVTVESPSVSCNNGSGGGFDGGTGGSGGMGGGGVVVIDQSVVGPYETVQLAAQDPQALTDWLTSHGYNIPADIQPIIDAYVAEQFGFLALKLVPGLGVSSMKPVRVTSPGAAPVLPLRMVAAGTGVSTAVNLWVFGEGRYEPQNFPSFLIEASDVTWNWDTMSSNYSVLRKKGFDDSDGFAWLVDYAGNQSSLQIEEPLQTQALPQYADQDGMNAQANLDADMDALFGSLDANNLWITHMISELSRPALANDLMLQAAADQSPVQSFLQTTKSTGTDPCGNTGGGGAGGGGAGGDASGGNAAGGDATGGDASGGNASGGNGGSGGDDGKGGTGSCSCTAVGGGGSSPLAPLGLGLGAALAAFRRRRRVQS